MQIDDHHDSIVLLIRVLAALVEWPVRQCAGCGKQTSDLVTIDSGQACCDRCVAYLHGVTGS